MKESSQRTNKNKTIKYQRLFEWPLRILIYATVILSTLLVVSKTWPDVLPFMYTPIGWRRVNIHNYSHRAPANVMMDLDNDGKLDNIEIRSRATYIIINDTRYEIGKVSAIHGSIDEERHIEAERPERNYYLLDLNGDKNIEIICTDSNAHIISPSSTRYSIYNYRSNSKELIKIGSVSTIGHIPDDIYVKDNVIQFEYNPHETPPDYIEKVTLNLEIPEK